MIPKHFRLVLFVFLAAVVICTLLGYAVFAQPVQAGAGEPTVKSSVELCVDFPDVWPWNRGGAPDSWTVSLWGDPGS
ncbi:MAG: hypothetical protein R6X31_13470 [Anaerolineae bacterium]